MKLLFFLGFCVASAYSRVASIIDTKSSDLLLTNLFSKDFKTVDNTTKIFGDKIFGKVNIQINIQEEANEQDSENAHTETNSNTIDTDNEPSSANAKVDNGQALILTPYIQEGRIAEARNASRVDPTLFLGFESYSGFFTVDEKYNSNVFFWYFPLVKKPVNENPWIIWLQGGPGASSLTGMFDEIGPFRAESDGKLKANPYTWLQNHSLVFIDNPVGAGYSFTDHNDGLVTDMATYSTHLYSVVKQLLQIFPELRTAPLYIAGESYGGKYVPCLGMEIHKHRNTPGFDINFKGLMVGNGYVQPEMIAHLTSPYYYFGLLDEQQLEEIKPLSEAFQDDIKNNRSVEAKQKFSRLIMILLLLTHQKHAYNFLRDDLGVGKYSVYLSRDEVKRALHVGDIEFSYVNVSANLALAPDFLSSAKASYETLLEQYRVLVYCGQLDEMVPCVSTSETYRTWRWNGSDEFRNARRLAYVYNKKLSGYHKTGGRLTEVVIRGAGHMAPLDQPGPIQYLIAQWTHDQPVGLYPKNPQQQKTFVDEYVKNSSVIFI